MFFLNNEIKITENIIERDNMDNNKKFNIFTFLSFFAKSMIEMFIPIILYNRGVSLTNIFIYSMFTYILSIIVILIIPYLNRIFKYKGLIIINMVFFTLTYIFMFNMDNSIKSLLILALLYTIHTSIYWILRHMYIIKVYSKENMSKSVGNILIFAEAAYLFSSYVGAIIMDSYNNCILILIATLILLIGNFFLMSIKINQIDQKINFSILKKIPKQDLIFFIFEQFKVIGIYIFPLYLAIYLNVSYKFIGLFNIVIGIASIIFIFWFSRLISKKKKSYMLPTTILYCLVWVLKINIKIKIIILVIAFLEGIISKIYQTSVTRFLYDLGRKFNTLEYVTVIEIFFNIIRFIIILFAVLFIKDLKILLYICTLGLLLTGFVKFNDLNKNS